MVGHPRFVGKELVSKRPGRKPFIEKRGYCSLNPFLKISFLSVYHWALSHSSKLCEKVPILMEPFYSSPRVIR